MITVIKLSAILWLMVVGRAASLARCHHQDLTYQIMSGFVFTDTGSIILSEVDIKEIVFSSYPGVLVTVRG